MSGSSVSSMRRMAEMAASSAFDLVMAPLERWKLHHIRTKLIARASGDVLEIGAGTGVNVPYYHPARLTSLTLSDRDDRRLTLADRVDRLPPEFRVRTKVRRLDAQRLPFDDATFDTVVATLLFCSVECPPCGFDEIMRVLKPGGTYLFLEHVRPNTPGTARFFDVINPVWNTLSRGCNLNRDTLQEMIDAGFSLDTVVRDGRNGVFVWGSASPS